MDDYERLYAELIINVGEKKDVSAKRTLELYLLVYKNDLPEEVRVRIRTLTSDLLRERKKALLEEILIRDDELMLIERGLPFETEEKETIVTQRSIPLQETDTTSQPSKRYASAEQIQGLIRVMRDGEHRLSINPILPGVAAEPPRVPRSDFCLSRDEAHARIEKGGIRDPLAKRILAIIRTDASGYFSESCVDLTLSVLKEYEFVNMRILKERFGVDIWEKDVPDFLSCARHLGIQNLPNITNPYHRLSKIYVIKRGTVLRDILPDLNHIVTSLSDGNCSYYSVSEFLFKNRRLPTHHELFDPVIETVFNTTDCGTYTRESFETFESRSRGYRFNPIKQVFSTDQNVVNMALEALRRYDGELVLSIDLTRAESRKPEFPSIIYMFKCDERGVVPIDQLKRELELDRI